jgi:hypothetical protein
MFQYEIPLPLELKRGVQKSKKINDNHKFIIRQKSSSHMSKAPAKVLKKQDIDKV